MTDITDSEDVSSVEVKLYIIEKVKLPLLIGLTAKHWSVGADGNIGVLLTPSDIVIPAAVQNTNATLTMHPVKAP